MDTTQAVFRFIREYIATHPWPPSLQEIADGSGLAHAASVYRHLDHLEAQGLLTREPGKARSIVLTAQGERHPL
jgi:repressor LexA